MFGTFLVLFIVVKHNRDQWLNSFHEAAETRIVSVQSGYDRAFARQTALAVFFESSDFISEREFIYFLKKQERLISTEHRVYEWAPRITPEARPLYENRMRQGHPGFMVHEISPSGTRLPAGRRDEYFPVTYLWPPEGSERELGFDIGTYPQARSVLEKAARTGEAAMSEPVKPAWDRERKWSYLIAIPVYKYGASPGVGRKIPDKPIGYTIGVYRYGTILKGQMRSFQPGNLKVYLFTSDRPESAPVFHYSCKGDRTDKTSGQCVATLKDIKALPHTKSRKLHIADREITIIITPYEQPRLLTWIDPGVVMFLLMGSLLSFVAYSISRGRVRDHLRLYESEERYRYLIKNSTHLIQSVSPEGNFLFVNESWKQALGYTDTQIRSMLMPDIILPDLRTECVEKMERVLSGERIDDLQTVFITAEGKTIDVEGFAVPFMENGSIAGTSAFFRDMTEPRRIERIRLVRYTANRVFADSDEIDEMYRSIIMNICNITEWIYGEIWLLDDEKQKMVFHDGWHREGDSVLGEFMSRSREVSFEHGEGFPGKVWASGQPIWDTTIDTNTMFIRNGLAAASGLHSAVAFPVFIDDDVHGVLMFFSPVVRQPEDDLLSSLGNIGRQIGQYIARKYMEIALQEERAMLALRIAKRTEELETATVAAEAANKAKSEFLATMSHELRTPLNSIIGFSEIMIDGMAGDLTGEQKDFLNDIHESGLHLLSLINDILDLSKVEAGRMELNPSPMSIASVLHTTLSLFREKMIKHNLNLKIQNAIGESEDEIFADERKIKQILFNLVSNAVKFTPDDGDIIIDVGKTTTDGKTYIEFSVTDTGIGISAENQKNLFRPFHQIDHSSSREYAGTGLGLSICRSFAALHGGTISVESEEGHGAAFRFTILVSGGAE